MTGVRRGSLLELDMETEGGMSTLALVAIVAIVGMVAIVAVSR